MPKVSVIIPVYNSARTLMACVERVLAQSFADFELLLCDDGSEDKSVALCNAFAEGDSRVRVFPLAHGGVSSARNCGLEYAAGEYIAFADSDDLPEPDWLSTLLGQAKSDGLAVCGYLVQTPDGAILYDTAHTSDKEIDMTPGQFMEDIFSNHLMYQGYIWNKLFCRALIERDEPLRFDEGISFNEDRLFLFRYLRRCGRVCYSGEPRYGYVQKQGSGAYFPQRATELLAFSFMCNALREMDLGSALFYAEKDFFRAAALLYHAAVICHSPDAAQLSVPVVRLARYATEFGDYPPETGEKLTQALAWAAT